MWYTLAARELKAIAIEEIIWETKITMMDCHQLRPIPIILCCGQRGVRDGAHSGLRRTRLPIPESSW